MAFYVCIFFIADGDVCKLYISEIFGFNTQIKEVVDLRGFLGCWLFVEGHLEIFI